MWYRFEVMYDVKNVQSVFVQQIVQIIVDEIGVQFVQVCVVVGLFDEGVSVLFIVCYCKEVIGGLDDIQLCNLEIWLIYLCELEDCCVVVLVSIGEQGKFSDELCNDILVVDIKSWLEDLYLLYKFKCCICVQIVCEGGLELLVDGLLVDLMQDLQMFVVVFVDVDKGVVDIKVVLEGVCVILMECWGEDVVLVGELCIWLGEIGVICVCVVEGKEIEGVKYCDYFEYVEVLVKILLYCLLVLFCVCCEEILFLELDLGSDVEVGYQYVEGCVVCKVGIVDQGCVVDCWLLDVCCLIWCVKLYIYLLLDLFNQVCEKVEVEVIVVFGDNLKDLLLVVFVGLKIVFGLDLGICIGCKIVVVDVIGKLVVIDIIYLYELCCQWEQLLQMIKQLCVKYNVELIVIGNGIVSCEIDKLVGEVIKVVVNLKLQKVVVSEVGVLVYLVFEFVVREFLELDVLLCGVVLIVCCLQDLLVELVKIEFKVIGVG